MKKAQKEIHKYFFQNKELYDVFLSFIESSDDYYDIYSILINIIKKQKIQETPKKLEHFLHLITNITNNHNRTLNFFKKIEKILLFLENDIKEKLSNKEIFKIVFSSKPILLFFIKKGILSIEDSFINFLLDSGEENIPRYCHFFLPEIKQFEKEKISQIEREILNFDSYNLKNYDEKRLNGENDSYICSLIRNDSIDEFIYHVNKNIIPLSTRINPSIFETNSFLIKKSPSLIEYAAFFGSVLIFNYLRLNNVEISSEIWLYVIHSNNGELIHLLEFYDIKPEDDSYVKCFEEAIKCHHNNLAIYIYDNLMIQNIDKKHEYDEKVIEFSLKYTNYNFFPKDLTNIVKNNTFFYLCYFDYLNIVKDLLKIKKKDTRLFERKYSTKIKTIDIL